MNLKISSLIPVLSAIAVGSCQIRKAHAFAPSTSIPLKTLSTLNYPSTLYGSKDDADDETKKLLEQAARIRAEIAQLENKSIEEVEKEAREKKQQQQSLHMKQEERSSKRKEELANNKSGNDDGRFLYVPETAEDQIRQATSAIERAFQDKVTRQTVRLALIKENSLVSANPEEWPGGAKQMYREAGRPLTEELLKEIRAPTESVDKNAGSNVDRFMAPNVTSQDIWDFDGSGLVTAEAAGGKDGDVQAIVFPNTDLKYVKDIETLDNVMGKRLLLLINPFWRNVDSWGFNILAPNGKKRAQEVIFDKGYDETYVLQRYSVRGEQCVALKVYPYDWQLFAYKEEQSYGYNGIGMVETALRLGSSKEEPNTALFTELLNGREEFRMSRNMRQMKNMFDN